MGNNNISLEATTLFSSILLLLSMLNADTVKADFLHTDYTLGSFIELQKIVDDTGYSKSLRLQAEAHFRGVYFGYRDERLSIPTSKCFLPEEVNTGKLISKLIESAKKDKKMYYPKMSLSQALRAMLRNQCEMHP